MPGTFVIIENSTGYTGAFKAALQEAMLLKNKKRFVFILPKKSVVTNYLQEAGITFYSLPMREISRSPLNLLQYFPALILNYFRLRKIVRREGCEIVQVNDFYNLLGVMLKLFGYKGKLITYVRFLPSALPGLLRKIWVRAAQRYSYRVIAVSDAVLQQLPKKKNTVRIYDPIELPERYSEKISTESQGGVRFLYLANYTRGKGQELAIEAFAAAYRQQQNIRLHFYGGDMGLKKNKDFRRELEEEVKRLGLTEVILFNDFASDTETVIKSYDVLLNFSQAESFSMTCAEASYYGLPVIATRCGGPEEIIAHQATGLLVNVNALDEMTAALLRLASHTEQRTVMGLKGRQYVRDKFSAAEFMDLFGRWVL